MRKSVSPLRDPRFTINETQYGELLARSADGQFDAEVQARLHQL